MSFILIRDGPVDPFHPDKCNLRPKLFSRATMIFPPDGTYFIHGIKIHSGKLIDQELCVSLQKDGHTIPLRPIGFILEIKQIIAAFDRDATSKLEFGKRVFSKTSRKLRNYSVFELAELVEKTPKGKHNELWVKLEDVEIIGGYSVGLNKCFSNRMKNLGLPFHQIGTN